jgi:protein SCO1/2
MAAGSGKWLAFSNRRGGLDPVSGKHYRIPFCLRPGNQAIRSSQCITVLTPAGKVSRYFAGIEYPPKDLRLALIEASNNHIGSLTEQLFLLCFHYDPASGKYGLLIKGVIQFAGISTVLVLGCCIVLMIRREHPSPS